MKKELLNLGCEFTLDDIEKQFNDVYNTIPVFSGVRQGHMVTGAVIIANVLNSKNGMSFATEKFLSVDDQNSIYHFIRVATGDSSYTKASISKKKR